jgi:hypothetical protein
MAHDYAYGIRLDSEGSPTALSTATTNVRILPEVYAAQRAKPSRQANRHGTVLEARTFYDSFSFILQVDLDYGNPEDPDTVYANLATVLARANHNLERVWLTRTAPDQGDVEIPIVIRRPPQTSNPRHRLRIPCFALDPFWRDRAVTHSAVDPTSGVTNGGSAPIGDAVLVFSGAGTTATLAHTTRPGNPGITIATDTTVNAVTVDCEDRSVSQLGSPVDGIMNADLPELLELVAGANAFTVSSGAVALTARDKWF